MFLEECVINVESWERRCIVAPLVVWVGNTFSQFFDRYCLKYQSMVKRFRRISASENDSEMFDRVIKLPISRREVRNLRKLTLGPLEMTSRKINIDALYWHWIKRQQQKNRIVFLFISARSKEAHRERREEPVWLTVLHQPGRRRLLRLSPCRTRTPANKYFREREGR